MRAAFFDNYGATRGITGEDEPERIDSTAYVASLNAVNTCGANISLANFDPAIAEQTFSGLYEALGYPVDRRQIAIQSIEDPFPGEEFHPRLIYSPLNRHHDVTAHIAGITALISEAPSTDLTVEDRAELIANLINTYCSVSGDTWGPPKQAPVRKGLAIRAARAELSARINSAISKKDIKFCHDLLESVNRTTHYSRRVAAAVGVGLLGVLLITRKT